MINCFNETLAFSWQLILELTFGRGSISGEREVVMDGYAILNSLDLSSGSPCIDAMYLIIKLKSLKCDWLFRQARAYLMRRMAWK